LTGFFDDLLTLFGRGLLYWAALYV